MRPFGPSLYYASDKVILDALGQRRVTVELLRQLLEARGIYVSPDCSKDDMAKFMSRQCFDYFDHQQIAERLGRIASRERITSFELGNTFSEGQVLQALSKTKQLMEQLGDRFIVTAEANRVVAAIEYQELDPSQSEFRQVKTLDATIEFIQRSGGGYLIRSTHNSYIDRAVSQTCSFLSQDTGEKIDRRAISLESKTDPRQRTKFFQTLIASLPDYDLITVTDAYCYQAPVGSDSTDAEESAEKVGVEAQPYVEKITLKGNGVDRSFIISDVYKKDYYLVKVVWHVRKRGLKDSDLIELEAQFSDPRSCTGFSYQMRHILACENGIPTGTKRAPSRSEQEQLLFAIEAGARTAYSAV